MRPLQNEAMREAAVRRGYDKVVLRDIARTPDDPEDYDYTKITTDAELIVQVRVKDIGLYSKTFENDTVPVLDLAVIVAGRRSGSTLVDDDFSYGVNADRNAYWAVPASDKYRFSRFGDVLDGADLVDEGWHVGAQALAQRIVDHLGEPARR